MLFLLLLKAGVIMLNSSTRGEIPLGGSILMKVTPAGDRDEDCSIVTIRLKNRPISINHDFCRAARIYRIDNSVIIINDNVSLSTLSLYAQNGPKIIHKTSRSFLNFDANSIILRDMSRNNIRFDIIGTIYRNGLNERSFITYRCVRVSKVNIIETKGKCV